MKKLAIVLALSMFAASAFAGLPGKTELGLTGEYVQTEGPGKNPWTFNLSMLLPVGQGHIVIGPALAIGSDDDFNRLGAGLEWNLMGQKSVSPYIGAAAYYFQKDADGLDRHTVLGTAGVKINVTKNAAIKVGALQVVDGRGKAETDLSVTAGIIAKF